MVRVLVCSYRLPGDVFRLGARVVFLQILLFPSFHDAVKG